MEDHQRDRDQGPHFLRRGAAPQPLHPHSTVFAYLLTFAPERSLQFLSAGALAASLTLTIDVPPDALAKFALFQASNKGGGTGLLVDSEDWRVPEQKFATRGNPDTLQQITVQSSV